MRFHQNECRRQFPVDPSISKLDFCYRNYCAWNLSKFCRANILFNYPTALFVTSWTNYKCYPGPAVSIWFEIWGSWIRVKKINFRGKFSKNFEFFLAISPTKFNFSRQISEKFRFHKIDFPCKNWPFTATSRQIILFLFKNNHFRTYFMHMIRYRPNDISRSVHCPPRPPAQNLGVAIPKLPGLTPLSWTM